jgi:hypothetical protein
MWIEASALGELVRGSGVWTYGAINLAHIVGVATLFGSILILDLRLLGWRRGIPLSSLAAVTSPVAAVGFGIAAVSGICLLATNATEYVGNPFLPIKFAAIALGLVNVVTLSQLSAWKASGTRELIPRERFQLAAVGGVSLLCWLTALGSGRMIGYW